MHTTGYNNALDWITRPQEWARWYAISLYLIGIKLEQSFFLGCYSLLENTHKQFIQIILNLGNLKLLEQNDEISQIL